jgi:predicted alpha/beta hydrolase family esterase
MRFVLIPGMGCTPTAKSNWYAWFAGEMQKRGNECSLCDFPDPYGCKETVWVPFIRDKMGLDESTILVGHSSGAACAMRLLESRSDDDPQVLGAILVAAAYTDLDDEEERNSQYFNRPWDWEKMKSSTKSGIVLFHGTDDHLIPVSEARHIAGKLKDAPNFEYRELPGMSHFFSPWQEILDVVDTKFSDCS